MSTSVRVRVRFTDVNRRAWMRVALFTLALLLAVLAQRAIYDSGQWLGGALVYVGAFVLLFVAWTRDTDALAIPIREPSREIPIVAPAHPARKFFVFPSILFALIAFFEFRYNTFAFVGTSAWLTALVLFCVAFWEGSLRAARSNLHAAIEKQPRGVVLALAGIMLLGALFYFYRLNTVPAEMTSDHVEKILDTFDILNGKFSIFLNGIQGANRCNFI